MSTESQSCGRYDRVFNRRQFLQRAGGGFGLLALASLLEQDGLLAADVPLVNPFASRLPHFPPKAKSIIWLMMEGGPSGFDLFDPKPELTRHDGKRPAIPIHTHFGNPGPLMKSPFAFAQHGASGAWVCEKLPHLAKHVDDIAFIKSCYAESNNHAPALLQMNTGLPMLGRPSAGAWTLYGLGTENQDLPGFVVMQNSRGTKGGPVNWGSGFLPAAYQGTTFRNGKSPILNLQRPEGMSADAQRAMLDFTADLNREHLATQPGEGDLLARIQSYELAFAMQHSAAETVDLSRESEGTKQLYGLDDKVTRPYGEKCLLARRLVERGVRFVQAYCNDAWDAHNKIEKNHTQRCAETDRPIAALLTDLKQRGLLDTTLVIWGGEFGRMPVSESGDGRDHNPEGFLMWMAGGGVKGGVSYGETDEIGWRAVDDRVSVHDLHATMLHLLGLNHKKLTYLHNGRQFRLTDVSGNVLTKILS
jgi:hypothetical protein